MTDYFDLLPVSFHLFLLFSLMMSGRFSKYARERMNPSFESPPKWHDEPTIGFRFWLKFLILEDGFFFASMFGLNLVLFIEYPWWYGIIFFLELVLFPGLIFGFLMNFISVKYPDRWLTMKSISFVSDIIVYYLIFSLLPFSINLFGYQMPVWLFLAVAGAIKLLPWLFSMIKIFYLLQMRQ